MTRPRISSQYEYRPDHFTFPRVSGIAHGGLDAPRRIWRTVATWLVIALALGLAVHWIFPR